MSSNQRVKAILAGLFLVFALVLASCAPPAGVEVTSARIQAWVGGPRDGVEVPMGQVPVLCHAFARAGVAQIELWVNGAFANRAVNTAPGETYFTAELSFQATGPGTYVLVCLTGDQDGETVRSEPVTVTVSGEEAAPTATPPEIPTATPTSTEVPPTATPPPPTRTGVPPTATRIPPTATRIPPTSTPPPPTPTTPPPRVVITMFEVSKTQIMWGECVRFTWRVEGAPTAIRLAGEGVGNYPDFRDKCPTSTRDFVLEAENEVSTDSESITVVVIQPSPSPDDRTGPSITNVNPIRGGQICTGTYCAPADRSLDISATVSDLSGVRSVELYCIFINGGTQPEQYCGAFVQSGGNNWVIDYTPPPSFYSGTIKYRIKATDDSPLRNVSWWGTGYISVLPGIG